MAAGRDQSGGMSALGRIWYFGAIATSSERASERVYRSVRQYVRRAVGVKSDASRWVKADNKLVMGLGGAWRRVMLDRELGHGGFGHTTACSLGENEQDLDQPVLR